MIRFEEVTKSYRGQNRPALEKLSVEVARGEFVFVVGASGSGKSTFLRLILREERPGEGSIFVLGKDIAKISNRKVPLFRRNMGVVFQDFRLLPGKTVYENVAFTLQVIGKSRGFIQEAVVDVLTTVGLAEKANRLPHELSGGEQQRVAIARAVVNKPAILLADEPTGNLDPVTSAGIMNVLERINASGTTVIMATHDSTIVNTMQRRVIELVAGHLVRDEVEGTYQQEAALAAQDTGMIIAPVHVTLAERLAAEAELVPTATPESRVIEKLQRAAESGRTDSFDRAEIAAAIRGHFPGGSGPADRVTRRDDIAGEQASGPASPAQAEGATEDAEVISTVEAARRHQSIVQEQASESDAYQTGKIEPLTDHMLLAKKLGLTPKDDDKNVGPTQ